MTGRVIELIRTVAWGDVLMSTAAMAGLKAQGYRLRYVTTESLSTVLHHNPSVDQVIVVPPIRTGNWWRQRELKAMVALATERLEPAARQIFFQNSPTYGVLRSGLNQVFPGLGDGWPPVNHHLIHVCRQAEVPYNEQLQLVLNDEEQQWATAFKDAVLFHMFSSNPLKDWPVEHWKALSDRITSDFGRPVFQVGKPWHEQAGVIESINNPTMRHAMAAVGQCRLLVGVDSVFNHVSRALNKPAVILFGVTHPGQFGYRQNINLWQGAQWPFETPPTAQAHRLWQQAPMAPLTVETVYSVVAQRLEQLDRYDQTLLDTAHRRDPEAMLSHRPLGVVP